MNCGCMHVVIESTGEYSRHWRPDVVDDAGAIDGYDASAKGILSDAVRSERERFKSLEPSHASTELGKTLQGRLAGSGHHVDTLVEVAAEERLLKEEDDDDDRKPN